MRDNEEYAVAFSLNSIWLWEMYLITHADIAPSHVDHSADMIEHVLGGELVAKLEAELFSRLPTTPAA